MWQSGSALGSWVPGFLGSSWAPLPYCSPPRSPFPIKSLALSACVSPWTIHFQVLGKSPLSDRRRGFPFLQQLCPTLGDPMDYNLADSSVRGILQARILKWTAISFSRASSQPKDPTGISCVSRIGRWVFFPTEPPGKPHWIHITIFLSSSVGTKASIQVEDGNVRLNIRFLLPYHQPIRRKSAHSGR